jgi:hypothetical protein
MDPQSMTEQKPVYIRRLEEAHGSRRVSPDKCSQESAPHETSTDNGGYNFFAADSVTLMMNDVCESVESEWKDAIVARYFA